MHHYRDTDCTTHISQPRTSPQVFRTPWRPLVPTSSRISHSESPQKSFYGHLGLTYLLTIILGASLLQSLGWLLDMVSRGQPSLMFLQHQEVSRWIAWDQSYLSQAFLGLPAMASWILATYLVGSLFCSFEQFSPSDAPDPHPLVSSYDTLDPSFPQHHRAPTRPPHFLATSAFNKHPCRFHRSLCGVPHPFRSRHPSSSSIFFSPAHGGATRCGFHPRYPLRLAASIPATLSASALLHRPTVALLSSHPTLFPLLVVHFCSSSLISPLSSVGCHVKWAGGGGGGGGGVLLFLLLLFTCSRSTSQPLLHAHLVALLSSTFPSPPSRPSPPSLSSAESCLSS